MQLIHGTTIAVTPDKTESILGDDGQQHNLSGHGIVSMIGHSVLGLPIGKRVFYNALAGSYIEDLNLVVVDIKDVYITE
jgi:hypothetical protein